jgi:hypothetical protein
MTALTNKQRQSDRRARLSAGGLFKRNDFYVHKDDLDEMRKHETRLRKRRIKDASLGN